MKPKAFYFYLDYIDNIEDLSDEEVGQLIKALLIYANTGEIVEMTRTIKQTFIPMRKQMDVEFKEYERTVNARSEAGKKGMQSRWGNNKS